MEKSAAGKRRLATEVGESRGLESRRGGLVRRALVEEAAIEITYFKLSEVIYRCYSHSSSSISEFS